MRSVPARQVNELRHESMDEPRNDKRRAEQRSGMRREDEVYRTRHVWKRLQGTVVMLGRGCTATIKKSSRLFFACRGFQPALSGYTVTLT